MAELEAKVNMSLDDIIRMEKKKKSNFRPNQNIGRGNMRNNMRGGPRGNSRGGLRNNMGNNRGNMRNNMYNMNRMNNSNMNRMNNNMNRMNNNMNHMNRMNNNMNHMNRMNNMNMNRMNNNRMNNNRRGQWRRYPQNNNMYGGYVQKRYNNNGPMNQNLRRSRSSMSLNRVNGNNNSRGSRGGYSPRRGGRFGLYRSRSRSNLSYSMSPYIPETNGFLQRTNSLPDLRDSPSVYNRLGYQNPNQAAYRNRIKKTKAVIAQKNLIMQNALQISPTGNNVMPIERRQRRYSVGSLQSEQILRAQRRAQYEEKLARINSRVQAPEPMDYLSSLNDYASQRPTLSSTQSQKSTPTKRMREKSSYNNSFSNSKSAPKEEQIKSPLQGQRRGRSRSRSRVRARRNSVLSMDGVRAGRNSVLSMDGGDLEDRSFSEVMYSLSNNFGITGRSLNDRFSLIQMEDEEIDDDDDQE